MNSHVNHGDSLHDRRPAKIDYKNFQQFPNPMKSFILRLKRLIRLSIPSKSRFAIRILYARSLGWSFLPKKPQPIIGKIFGQDSISLPWFSYPALAQLLRFDLYGEFVLEYGGGSSTSFFLEQGARVLTIEDSPQ